MHPLTARSRPTSRLSPLLLPLALLACRPLSERVSDPRAGLNGGFELAREGLPLNWSVYSPRTVAEGSYELDFDRDEFVEGAQSLRFRIDSCSTDGGWRSPGLFREFAARTGTRYTVRFHLKSQGCAWTASVGGVAAKVGAYERVQGGDDAEGNWELHEMSYTVERPHERLRFELGITSPGTLWIDGLEIEPPPGASPGG